MLEEILNHKRQEIAERERHTPLDDVRWQAASASSPRAPLFDRPVSLIAEVKRRSPSQGDFVETLDPVEQAQAYEHGGASAISVLTDQRYFRGSLADLRAVRAAVSLPVLCKDFFLSPYQVYEARAAGADLVLLIMAALKDDLLRPLLTLVQELGMTALLEVHNQHDLARAIAADATLIGINNRDLNDFSVDLLTTEYLAPLVPDEMVVVSESGITSREDLARVAAAGASVVLVGEALMRADNPETAIQALLA